MDGGRVNNIKKHILHAAGEKISLLYLHHEKPQKKLTMKKNVYNFSQPFMKNPERVKKLLNKSENTFFQQNQITSLHFISMCEFWGKNGNRSGRKKLQTTHKSGTK